MRRSLTSDDDDDDFYVGNNDAQEGDDDDRNTMRSRMRTGRLRRISSRYSLRARSLRERWRLPITSQGGLDGAIESAIGGMLFASRSVPSSRGSSPRKVKDEDRLGHVEKVERETFGLARPIMSGIRARIGVLRGRAETAPAKLETAIVGGTGGNRARFIAGDEQGANTPVRLMQPAMLSDGWRWSVC